MTAFCMGFSSLIKPPYSQLSHTPAVRALHRGHKQHLSDKGTEKTANREATEPANKEATEPANGEVTENANGGITEPLSVRAKKQTLSNVMDPTCVGVKGIANGGASGSARDKLSETANCEIKDPASGDSLESAAAENHS